MKTRREVCLMGKMLRMIPDLINKRHKVIGLITELSPAYYIVKPFSSFI